MLPFIAFLMSVADIGQVEVEQSLPFTDSGVHWRLDVLNDQRTLCRMVALFRNGRQMATYGNKSENIGVPMQDFGSVYFKVGIPKVRAPFKVAAIRSVSGVGHAQETLFLGFRNGKAFQMGSGSQSGEVGGPINWAGRPDLWLFDDYNWHVHYDLKETAEPLHRLLYRIGKDSKLRFVRRWIAPVRRKLPDTVGLHF